MKQIIQLAWKILRTGKRKTFLTVLSIFLAFFLICSGGISISSLTALLAHDEEKSTGSWHYMLSEENGGRIPSGTVLADQIQECAGIQSVGLTDRRSFLRIPSEAGAYYYRLVTCNPAGLAQLPYGARLLFGRLPENDSELMISSASSPFWNGIDPLGKTYTLESCREEELFYSQEGYGTDAEIEMLSPERKTYTVVGIFQRYHSSGAINVSEAVTVSDTVSNPTEILIRIRDSANFEKTIHSALQDSAVPGSVRMERHSDLFRWIQKGSGKMQYAPYLVFLILAAAVLVVTVTVIRNACLQSVQDQVPTLGILRCLCASDRQIRSLILSEGLILYGLALPPGILFSILFLRFMIYRVNQLGISVLDGLHLSVPVWVLAGSAALSLLAVLLSSFATLRKACSVSPLAAISGESEDPMLSRPGQPADAPLQNKTGSTLRLLSARYRSRNPSRSRTITLTVAMSVGLSVLFAGGAAFLRDYADDYTNAGSMDFLLVADHHVISDSSPYAALREELSKEKGILRMQEVYVLDYVMNVPQDRVAPGYENTWWRYYDSEEPFWAGKQYEKIGSLVKRVEVISVSRENYDSLVFQDARPSYDDLLRDKSVLLCQTEVLRKNGYMEILDATSFKTGDVLRLAFDFKGVSDPIERKVAGVLLEIPWFAPERSHGFILVPIETMDSYFLIYNDHANHYGLGMLAIDAENSMRDSIQQNLEKRTMAPFGSMAGYSLISPYARNLEVIRACALINLFAYGFLAIILLICAMNIYASIRSDLESRRHDTAVLRAVGMTSVQLRRYLFGESVRYGIIGLLIGDLFGFMLLAGLIKITGRTASLSGTGIPWILLLSLLATLLTAVLSAAGPVRNLECSSISEEIRSDL